MGLRLGVDVELTAVVVMVMMMMAGGTMRMSGGRGGRVAGVEGAADGVAHEARVAKDVVVVGAGGDRRRSGHVLGRAARRSEGGVQRARRGR